MAALIRRGEELLAEKYVVTFCSHSNCTCCTGRPRSQRRLCHAGSSGATRKKMKLLTWRSGRATPSSLFRYTSLPLVTCDTMTIWGLQLYWKGEYKEDFPVPQSTFNGWVMRKRAGLVIASRGRPTLLTATEERQLSMAFSYLRQR